MRWFWSIETNVSRSFYEYDHARECRIRREVFLRRWPKLISKIFWTLSKPIHGHVLMSDDIHMEVLADSNTLLVDGENLVDWIKQSCRGEVGYFEDFAYVQPHARMSQFMDATVRIDFLNPKDAMLFKLRFG